jgi:hypothetical protein
MTFTLFEPRCVPYTISDELTGLLLGEVIAFPLVLRRYSEARLAQSKCTMREMKNKFKVKTHSDTLGDSSKSDDSQA